MDPQTTRRIIWSVLLALIALNLLLTILSHYWPLLLLLVAIVIAGRVWINRTWL